MIIDTRNNVNNVSGDGSPRIDTRNNVNQVGGSEPPVPAGKKYSHHLLLTPYSGSYGYTIYFNVINEISTEITLSELHSILPEGTIIATGHYRSSSNPNRLYIVEGISKRAGNTLNVSYTRITQDTETFLLTFSAASTDVALTSSNFSLEDSVQEL